MKHMYRAGQFGISHAGEGQYWSLSNPLVTANYVGSQGLPVSGFDFVIAGRVSEGVQFVTRYSPGIGNNPGGALEVVVPVNGVSIQWFHIP